ncbi:MAG: YcbK family protein [Janthinobacterium lividum]
MANQTTPSFTRRQFVIGSGAVGLASLFSSCQSFAASLSTRERSLVLFNGPTGEWFKEPYWIEGQYLPDALKRINHILRDKINGKVSKIDQRLLDLMHAMQHKIGAKKPMEIICGYRSQETNQHLRKISTGVAKNSLHMTGRAVDIRMEGFPLSKFRDLAKSLKAGGVGYYPQSNFIHVDVRPQPYYW